MNFISNQATGKFTILLALLLALNAAAGTLHVDINSANPVSPYTDWSTAATNVQDAIDAAGTGDLVLVNDGVYQSGGRVVYGALTNRVAVTNAVTVQSVNGPGVTVIQGYQVPGTTNGDAAIRCAYLTNDAVLSGFTLTSGATRSAGDILSEQSGGAVYCETSAIVTNCVLDGNSAALFGGGCFSGILYSCTLVGNQSRGDGGGAYSAALHYCMLVCNSAASGGGGAAHGTLNSCTVMGNSAVGGTGGGVNNGTLNNCTIIRNSSGQTGGGITLSTANNCIVYFNSAPNGSNYSSSATLTYSCTAPLPTGAGNIAADPQLLSISHIGAFSPCRNAGSSDYVSGTDIDGEPWGSPPSIGCDEYNPAAMTGPLSASIWVDYTNVFAGMSVNVAGDNQGRISASWWDLGDGTVISNRAFMSHAWTTPGNYTVRFHVYNDSNPDGVVASVTVRVGGPPARYVALNSPTPLAPYDSWSTAATNIQDAIDAAFPGETIAVSNGIYEVGGRVVGLYILLTNRVAITKPVLLQSVNGPDVTVIKGYQVPGTTNGFSAARCVYLGSGAWLSGFTLTNGATFGWTSLTSQQDGGGVWCDTNGVGAVVSNCVIVGNAAYGNGGGAWYGYLTNCVLGGNSSAVGGGSYFATLHNCALTNNNAGAAGGDYRGTLVGCTLAGNWAGGGGGAVGSTLINCIVSSNRAVSPATQSGGGGTYGCSVTNSTFSGNSSASLGGGAYLGTLVNCVLIGNSAGRGGGASGSTLYNCLITNNTAVLTLYQFGYGGGADSSTLNNCTLAGNSAAGMGGGANGGTLTNCTLIGNSAIGSGGGMTGAILRNCILYSNSAPSGADYYTTNLTYCCTRTLPRNSIGNFTNAPLFVDPANGNFCLVGNSPCINAGLNAYVTTSTDSDGNPRISGGTVDVGAYEFQNPASTISYAWLQQFGLPLDGSADAVDFDHDGMNNWQEWRAGTDPTNALSVLQMLSPTNGASGVTVTWQSVTNRSYYLQRSLDLLAQPPFINVQSNIVGQAGTTSYMDTNAAGAGPFFYRVGVQ